MGKLGAAKIKEVNRHPKEVTRELNKRVIIRIPRQPVASKNPKEMPFCQFRLTKAVPTG